MLSLLLCIHAICKVLCFILFDDDFEIKSKIYRLNCLSCFIHIFNCKMSLFFGLCFFLYFLKLLAGRGFSTCQNHCFIALRHGRFDRRPVHSCSLQALAPIYRCTCKSTVTYILFIRHSKICKLQDICINWYLLQRNMYWDIVHFHVSVFGMRLKIHIFKYLTDLPRISRLFSRFVPREDQELNRRLQCV